MATINIQSKPDNINEIAPLQILLTDNNTPINVSGGVVKLMIKKPDGTLKQSTMTFLTDGTDGVVYDNFTENDLNQNGVYEIQCLLDFVSRKFHSNIAQFTINRNLG